MSVATHLNIRLEEYDSRIQTFIPGYEDMLEAAARCLLGLDAAAPLVVELGIGTGALAARCVAIAARATILGIDEDAGILELARARLGPSAVSLVQASFLDVDIPACDAVFASLALHHVADRGRKEQLYRQIARAVRPGGLFVTADCFPSSDARLAEVEQRAWRDHLRATYSDAETDQYFSAWALEDTYVPLDEELVMLRRSGFGTDIVWRRGSMGVIAARRS
jgi:tRNA (cmo5U34)-methyltransferase